MRIRNKILAPLLLFTTFLGFESCVTTYQPAYPLYKKDIYINLNEHNLGYLLPQDTLVPVFKQANIDQFDKDFFGALYYNLSLQYFPDTCSGKMGIVSLKNCMIDMKVLPQYPKEFHGDTLYINYLQTNLVCKSEEAPGGLFFAYANVPENYTALVLRNNDSKFLDPNKWVINKHSAYQHQGFNETLLNRLAFNLAINTAINIDSLAKYDFTVKHPDIANTPVASKKLSNISAYLIFIPLALLAFAFL